MTNAPPRRCLVMLLRVGHCFLRSGHPNKSRTSQLKLQVKDETTFPRNEKVTSSILVGGSTKTPARYAFLAGVFLHFKNNAYYPLLQVVTSRPEQNPNISRTYPEQICGLEHAMSALFDRNCLSRISQPRGTIRSGRE